jgi:hypothetical protein
MTMSAVRSVASYKRHLQRVNKGHQQQPAGPAGPRDIIVPETITVPILPTAWRAAPWTSSRC